MNKKAWANLIFCSVGKILGEKRLVKFRGKDLFFLFRFINIIFNTTHIEVILILNFYYNYFSDFYYSDRNSDYIYFLYM